MGWFAPRSSSLRAVLQTQILFPLPKFREILSGALSCPSDPIARSSTSNSDSVFRSQESQEFDRPAIAPRFCSGSVSWDRLYATTPKSVSPCEEAAQEFVATSCSRGLFSGVRVRGLGQIARGFSSTSVKQQVDAKCWSCEEKSTASPFFVCSSCRAIQPLDQDVDFFQLLSVDRSYIQDPKVLEKKYKQLQKFLHPDLSSGKSEREQGYAANQSAQVIKAYYTLLGPLSRAQYMLKLNGVNVDEEGTIHDPALLMEIMELREEVEAATDADKLIKIKEEVYFVPFCYLPKNKKKMSEVENDLKAVFQSGDITNAVPLVQRMTYYHKIIEEITRKQ